MSECLLEILELCISHWTTNYSDRSFVFFLDQLIVCAYKLAAAAPFQLVTLIWLCLIWVVKAVARFTCLYFWQCSVTIMDTVIEVLNNKVFLLVTTFQNCSLKGTTAIQGRKVWWLQPLVYSWWVSIKPSITHLLKNIE